MANHLIRLTPPGVRELSRALPPPLSQESETPMRPHRSRANVCAARAWRSFSIEEWASVWCKLETNPQFAVAAEPHAGVKWKGSPCYLLPNTLRSPFGQGVPEWRLSWPMCLKKYCCIAAKLRSSRASSSQQRASSAKDWIWILSARFNPICHPPAANSWRTLPSRPRASARSRALGCGLRGTRRPSSTATAHLPARQRLAWCGGQGPFHVRGKESPGCAGASSGLTKEKP